ncbi:hypothetical protein BH14210 [Bartonella henselae str. Houston-1]|uniref:Uncharacterized protein n=1 Tax=Bartonella henselae (strain ATCC 49882 / DSM 28221 / CCUG 30454 / Houston 1) TaxID=283166 RepID=A0A0H3LZL5_BARHE|nr:hypothetical protein BH14210 [Bartonella henselae str. Houston-1]
MVFSLIPSSFSLKFHSDFFFCEISEAQTHLFVRPSEILTVFCFLKGQKIGVTI